MENHQHLSKLLKQPYSLSQYWAELKVKVGYTWVPQPYDVRIRMTAENEE